MKLIIQVDKGLDIVMLMYNLIEYSDNYSRNIWRFVAVDNNYAIVDFTDNNLTDSFNFKVKMTG